MFWNKRKKNRRLGRVHVLDVKVRSNVAAAARARRVGVAVGFAVGALLGLVALWTAGQWLLNQLVYENKTFAIQQIDVETDGVISTEQLRRWSKVKRGQNLLALEIADVKRDLESVPWVHSVSIERVLPSTLRIRVVEREPIAQINVPRPGRNDSGIELVVYQVDSEGWVMVPLDPRQRAVPLSQADRELPVISGISFSEVQPGRRIELPQMQAAIRLLNAFEGSSIAGLVDLQRVDVSSSQVLTVTTGQGGEIVFGLSDFDRQLRRWQQVHQECQRFNKSIAQLDLAVKDNSPLRVQELSLLPPSPPKTPKPQRSRKRNV